jgi:UrcA family protein
MMVIILDEIGRVGKENVMSRAVIMSLASLALIAGASLPAFASAQTIEFKSREVTYGDLNLASDKGAQAMLSRIQRAAEDVCSGAVFGTVADAEARHRFEACVADAVGHAVAGVHSAKLSALYAARGPAPSVETADIR